MGKRAGTPVYGEFRLFEIIGLLHIDGRFYVVVWNISLQLDVAET